MRKISQQEIMAMAPAVSTVSNARKISAGGGFVRRMRSEDDTFYMGECKGSGKSNYMVSADFIEGNQPIIRCSCPSRQFPCKHGLALLFEIEAGKEFDKGEIPREILDKRARKEAREAKKKEKKQAAGTDGEIKKQGKSLVSAAKKKKIQRQLEGLSMVSRITAELTENGLASMGSLSLKTYRDLAKQLGDYYLPGPLIQLNRLILEMEAYQKDGEQSHYLQAVDILVRLRALEKKSSVYLQGLLESGRGEGEDTILYEELGGIWKLDQLNQLGLKKENAALLQLAFQVSYDPARKEYIDTGYWADLDTGEISLALNYRPIKALKYVKQEDSCFSLLRIPLLTYYPGGINRRIRWEKAVLEEPDRNCFCQLKEKGWKDFTKLAKEVKNQLKNTLSPDFCAVLANFSRMGFIEGDRGRILVMEDNQGNRMELKDREGQEPSCQALSMIPARYSLENQAMFGLVYYHRQSRRLCMQPLSVVTDQEILRLLY